MSHFRQIGGSRVQDYRFYNAQHDQASGSDCPIDLMSQYEQVFAKQQHVRRYYPFSCNKNGNGNGNGDGNGNGNGQKGGGPTPLPYGYFQPNPKLCYADERQYPWAYGAENMIKDIPPQGCGCMFKGNGNGNGAQQKGGGPSGAPLYLRSSKHKPLEYNFSPFSNSPVVFDAVNGHSCH